MYRFDAIQIKILVDVSGNWQVDSKIHLEMPKAYPKQSAFLKKKKSEVDIPRYQGLL